MAANDPFGLTSSGIPPELQAQYRGLTRDQAIQEALLKQSMQPGGGVIDAGMFKVARSPMEGIARVAQAYLARKGLDRTDERMGDLGSRAAQMQAEEVRRYQQMKNGVPGMPERPAQIDPQEASQAADGMSPLPGPMPAEPGIPADPRGAVTGAMMSRNPMLQRLGALDLQQLNRVEDRKDTQDFQRQQAQIAAKNRSDDIAMRLAEGRITKEEADKRMADLRKDLADQQARSQENLVRVAAELRPPRQEAAPTVVEVVRDGKLVKIDAKTDRVIGDSPSIGKGKAMSATAQKELIQTDEEIQGGAQALSLLQSAKKINDKAMGFTGASAVASVGSLLPDAVRPAKFDATQELDNIVQSSALPQLKAIFGGMPTEGERKILLDVQGSSSKPASVRKGIFDRAEEAVNARLKFAKDKAKSLREGTYFAGDGAVNPAAAAAPSAAPTGVDPKVWAAMTPEEKALWK